MTEKRTWVGPSAPGAAEHSAQYPHYRDCGDER